MKRARLLPTLLLSLAAAAARAQSTAPAADVRTFELTPTPPPVPALKYELLYDALDDRRPGNAAILYFESILIMGPDVSAKSAKALDAHRSGDTTTFNSLAAELDNPALFRQLDLAARTEGCDWQPPIRELGVQTLLPHLEPITHPLTRTIKVRALRQLADDRPADALATLRLGYAMAEHVGTEPVLISALVSLAVTSQLNDALPLLMNRPDAPNLYWALRDHPSRRHLFRQAFHGERAYIVPSTPNLARALAGETLTAEESRALLAAIEAVRQPVGTPARPDYVKEAGPGTLDRARQFYADARRLSPGEVAKLDPIVPLTAFYVHHANVRNDDLFKLRNLPYPLLLAKAAELHARAVAVQAEQPTNPFLPPLNLRDVVLRFARVDRQIAALTAVEALRSHAAAHDGRLPQKLSDVTDTPVPNNPVTDEPFAYRLADDNTATLSDTTSAPHLTYTVRIRK
jgi:hypothetical protein